MKKKNNLKTITWLVVSAIIICVPVLLETGSLWIALSSSLWACLLKTPAYWLHEYLWEHKTKKICPSCSAIL